jgi:hypothetical protein
MSSKIYRRAIESGRVENEAEEQMEDRRMVQSSEAERESPQARHKRAEQTTQPIPM